MVKGVHGYQHKKRSFSKVPNMLSGALHQARRLMERFKLEPIPVSVPSETSSDRPEADSMIAQKIDYEFERRNLGGRFYSLA